MLFQKISIINYPSPKEDFFGFNQFHPSRNTSSASYALYFALDSLSFETPPHPQNKFSMTLQRVWMDIIWNGTLNNDSDQRVIYNVPSSHLVICLIHVPSICRSAWEKLSFLTLKVLHEKKNNAFGLSCRLTQCVVVMANH